MIEMEQRLAYVDVNEQGEIERAFIGVNIIPAEPFDFFFYIDENIEDIYEYKVDIQNFKPVLVAREVI